MTNQRRGYISHCLFHPHLLSLKSTWWVSECWEVASVLGGSSSRSSQPRYRGTAFVPLSKTVFCLRMLFCALVSRTRSWFLCARVLRLIKRHSSQTVGLFTHAVFHKVVNLAHPCLWMIEPFEDPPFIPNHDTFTCYQLTCLPVGFSKQVFFEHSTTSSVFVVPVPVFFFNVLLASNSE